MTKRKGNFYVSMLVDLSLIDQVYMNRYHSPWVEVGGSFGPVTITQRSLVLRDNLKITVSLGSVLPSVAKSVSVQWFDVMMGRIRGVLDGARDDGAFLNLGPPVYTTL